MADSNSSKLNDEGVEVERRGEASVFDVEEDIWAEDAPPDALTEFSVGPPPPAVARGSAVLRRREADSARSRRPPKAASVRPARRKTGDVAPAGCSPPIGAPSPPVDSDGAWPKAASSTALESLDLGRRAGVTGLLDQIIDEAVPRGASPGADRPITLEPEPESDGRRPRARSTFRRTQGAERTPPSDAWSRPRPAVPSPLALASTPATVALPGRRPASAEAVKRPVRSASAQPLMTNDLVLDGSETPTPSVVVQEPRKVAPHLGEPAFAHPVNGRATAPTAEPADLVDPSIEVLPARNGSPPLRSEAGARPVTSKGRRPDPRTDVIDREAAAMERAVAASVDTSVRRRPVSLSLPSAQRAARGKVSRIVMGQAAAPAAPASSPGGPDGRSGLELDEPKPELRRKARFEEWTDDLALHPNWVARFAFSLLFCLAVLTVVGLVHAFR